MDKELPKGAYSTEIKEKHSFNQLIEEIRNIGFDPQHLQHVKDFDLTHPQSWSTLTEEEYNQSTESS